MDERTAVSSDNATHPPTPPTGEVGQEDSASLSAEQGQHLQNSNVSGPVNGSAPRPSPGKSWGFSSQQSVLTQWATLAIGLPEIRVRVRPHANNLHILCEGSVCPEALIVVTRMLRVLATTNLDDLLPADQPQIYQVYLYGRVTGQSRPGWVKLIHLNQLDRYLEQLQQIATAVELKESQESTPLETEDPQPAGGQTNATLLEQLEHYIEQLQQIAVAVKPKEGTNPEAEPLAADQATAKILEQPVSATGSALIISNQSLARRGNPDAIARYLSETLSTLGVAVQVTVKTIDCPINESLESQQKHRRLWVVCQSTYSPPASLVSEPIAQQLRDLQLEDFQDAIIFSKVSGEEATDWTLRVDLTPPEEMLKEWARWGDVQSISQLLNQALSPHDIELTASLKESTLHLFCQSTQEAVVPDKSGVLAVVSPWLELLAPQGILAATLYGQLAGQSTPAWIEWLTLPATVHPALAESAFALAQQGDQPALLFLLHRLLNPDLNWRLATGGVRVQLLCKDDLLHIMSDAPTCPYQKQVGPPVVKLLRQLQIPDVDGVRVYGRRSGQKRPLWSYGVDFVPRQRLVPEATPEFAASDAYVGALLVQPPADLIFRPELTPKDVQAVLTRIFQEATRTVQHYLIQSHLFIPSEQTNSLGPDLATSKTSQWSETHSKETKAALIWAAVGILLMFGVDRVLGQILTIRASMVSNVVAPAQQSFTSSTPVQSNAAVPITPTLQEVTKSASNLATEPEPFVLPKLSLNKSGQNRRPVFNSSGFTQPGTNSLDLNNADPNAASSNPATPLVGETEPTQNATSAIARPGPTSTTPVANTSSLRSPYPSFNSRQLDQQLALYSQYLAKSGPPDVLIVGSSRALRGIDPVALQRTLAAQGQPQLKIFNFGVNGATAQVVNLIVRQFIAPNQLPKLILWADGARAFNSGRVDVTYNGILVSAGYKHLTEAGSSQTTKSSPADPSRAVASTPPAQTDVATDQPTEEGASPYAGVNDWLNQALSTVSATYAQRDQLMSLFQEQLVSFLPGQQPLLDSALFLPGTSQQTAAGGTKPVGSIEGGPMKDTLTYPLTVDGFMPLTIRFNPATYYQKYARVSGDFDSDYDSFQLEGRQSNALAALLEFTRTHNIPLVFANLPLTEDYLDPVRLEYEQVFQAYMLRLATQNGFLFRDLSQVWPTQNDYFSDPSHLNRYGADEVSQRLAQDPLIPWPQPDAASKKMSK